MAVSDTMPATSEDAAVLRIGRWRVDPALDEISSEGRTVRLEPLAMRLLLCLARHAGRPVELQQLLDEVWTGVIVAPGSVYQAIAQLRHTLGDDTEHPIYIDTVPRKGYRIIAPVSPWTSDSTAPPEQAAPERPFPGSSRADARGSYREAPEPAGAGADRRWRARRCGDRRADLAQTYSTSAAGRAGDYFTTREVDCGAAVHRPE